MEKRNWLDNLEHREERFTYDSVRYVLREPSHGAIKLWRDALLVDTEIGPDGTPVGLRVRASTDTLLTSKCLFRVVTGEDGGTERERACTEEEVDALPHRLQNKLMQAIRAMGEMNPIPDTVEACDKEVTECEERLVELRKQRSFLLGERPDPSKNGQSATRTCSA